MNPEDQIAALLAKANPVPSLDLLDPVESVDVDSLWEQSERGETTESMAIQTHRRFRRPALAQAMVTVAILVVVAIPALINVTPLVVGATATEQVAIAFMDAIVDHDGLAIREMWALEDQDDWSPDGWLSLTHINRALGFEYSDVDCADRKQISLGGTRATEVLCSWTVQQDLAGALGLESTRGNYLVYVSGGDIVRAREAWYDTSSWEESFEEFRSWVERSHPDDYWTMFSSRLDARLTIDYSDNYMSVEPEALILWERYVDEFVAEMGG